MALHIESTIKGKTHSAEWHVGEPLPDFVHDCRVVRFQADGNELDFLLNLLIDPPPPTIEGVLGEKRAMRILIAEDQPDLRELLTSLLESEGHTVVPCRDGSAALRTYIEDGPFDFVITDYQMPTKNGIVLIMDIRQQNPEQPVLLVSADPPTLPEHIKKLTGEFPVLTKPYRNAELLAHLREKK